MATYYVSKAGSDGTGDATNPTTPLLTIAAALVSASSDGDTVEIIDEGSYNEGDLSIAKHRITITHTASHLGRPKMYGVGTAGSGPMRAFNLSDVTGTVFQGLEIHSYTSYLANLNGHGASAPPFTLSGCFVHSFIDANCRYASHSLVGTADNPHRIIDSILYFPSIAQSFGIIAVDTTPHGHLHIQNTLLTSSHDGYLVRDQETSHTTCSFSTFINRHASTTSVQVQASKVINCIVSGSGADTKGVASDDHTYNLVKTNGAPWWLHPGGAEGSAGTGDIEADPLFVDGTAIGSSPSIAANFKLQEESPAVNAGTSYGGITHDLTGTSRPQGSAPDMGCFEYVFPPAGWNSYGAQPYSNIGGDFTVNLYQNLTSNYKLTDTNSPGQVPFSLGPKGPGTLRRRLGAYGVSKGGDPSVLIQTSSA